MTYEELYKRWSGRPPAWFAVDEIYEYYMRQAKSAGWDMPTRWLVSVEYEVQLNDLQGMYGIWPHEKGGYVIAGIPVMVGKFDFKIAVVARSPYQCRVGDFVEPGSLPPRFGDRDTIYIRPVALPQYSLDDELLPSAPSPTLVYRERRFFDGAGKVFSLWRRES